MQLLVKRLPKGFLFPPAINDGYELKVAQFGVNIDHKEEIFRSATSYVDSVGGIRYFESFLSRVAYQRSP